MYTLLHTTGKGCHCTKEFVDWCGCSPRPIDTGVMRSVLAYRSNSWFARKFDPRLDMRGVAVLLSTIRSDVDEATTNATANDRISAVRNKGDCSRIAPGDWSAIRLALRLSRLAVETSYSRSCAGLSRIVYGGAMCMLQQLV